MSPIYAYESPKDFLGKTLEDITKRNPSYSLRSFSRVLGLSPSHVSRVLKGTKKLSPTLATQVAQKLKLTSSESSYLHLLVQLENTKDEKMRFQILEQMWKKNTRLVKQVLSVSAFSVVAEWYHFAILALIKSKGFQSRPQWIAKKLGIKLAEAECAIERLVSLHLIERTSEGVLQIASEARITTSDGISSEAIRENHRQQMERAKTALAEQPLDLREFNNLAVVMSPRKIDKARALIHEFVDKFNEEMYCAEDEDLFQLNVQFFQSSVAE